jgi:hypothetical protein
VTFEACVFLLSVATATGVCGTAARCVPRRAPHEVVAGVETVGHEGKGTFWTRHRPAQQHGEMTTRLAVCQTNQRVKPATSAVLDRMSNSSLDFFFAGVEELCINAREQQSGGLLEV